MDAFWIVYWVVAFINTLLAIWLTYDDHNKGHSFTINDLVVGLCVIFVPVCNVLLGLLLLGQVAKRCSGAVIIQGKAEDSTAKSVNQNPKPDSET